MITWSYRMLDRPARPPAAKARRPEPTPLLAAGSVARRAVTPRGLLATAGGLLLATRPAGRTAPAVPSYTRRFGSPGRSRLLGA